MNQSLHDIKLKKYMAEYQYLELELAETAYQFDIYRKKFIDEAYGGVLPPQPPPQPPPEDIEPPQVVEPSPILKKLYKAISLKTHPDKTGGDDTLFKVVKKAYSEGNIFKLLNIATTLNIEIEDITTDSLELYELKIKQTRDEIENYKKKTAWVWAFASDTIKDLIRKSL
jgi:hypothetical protein